MSDRRSAPLATILAIAAQLGASSARAQATPEPRPAPAAQSTPSASAAPTAPSGAPAPTAVDAPAGAESPAVSEPSLSPTLRAFRADRVLQLMGDGENADSRAFGGAVIGAGLLAAGITVYGARSAGRALEATDYALLVTSGGLVGAGILGMVAGYGGPTASLQREYRAQLRRSSPEEALQWLERTVESRGAALRSIRLGIGIVVAAVTVGTFVADGYLLWSVTPIAASPMGTRSAAADLLPMLVLGGAGVFGAYATASLFFGEPITQRQMRLLRLAQALPEPRVTDVRPFVTPTVAGLQFGLAGSF